MSSNVSVTSSDIMAGRGCCEKAIQELESASRSLKNSYNQAGDGGWRDEKYAKLGMIVDECCNALGAPIGELQECIGKLDALYEAVSNYEETNL